MKIKKGLTIKIFTLSLLLLFLIPMENSRGGSNTMFNNDIDNDFNLNTSGYHALSGISIDCSGSNDWLWAADQPWCSVKNGYFVIEDVLIDGGGSGTGIEILNSDSKFWIENCSITNVEIGINIVSPPHSSGITFLAARSF